jgi:hypothetical protein
MWPSSLTDRLRGEIGRAMSCKKRRSEASYGGGGEGVAQEAPEVGEHAAPLEHEVVRRVHRALQR